MADRHRRARWGRVTGRRSRRWPERRRGAGRGRRAGPGIDRADPLRRRRARRLNATHMGKDGPTDVLSFPLLPPEAFAPRGAARGATATAGGRRPHLGDIVISVERAREQAETGRGGQTGDVRWSAADELASSPSTARCTSAARPRRACEEAAMRALESACSCAPRPRTARPAPGRPVPSACGPPAGRPATSTRRPDGIGPCSCCPRRDPVKLVVGLGNPGSQYAGTRHNIGWMVVDRLADRAGWAGRGRSGRVQRRRGRYRGLDLTLVKPLTYMNDSGLAVRKVARPRARAAARPARRRRRLRPAVRQAAVPRGRQPRRPQRPALDHRRARHREVQPAPGGHRRPGPRRASTTS